MEQGERNSKFTFAELIRKTDGRRDNFLSRLFSLFAEDVVRIWAACPQAPYSDLGRPTLYVPGTSKRSTIDFTLCDRRTGQTFVAELKCELAYENYRYLEFHDPKQLDHHKTEAFSRFVQCAKAPVIFEVRVGGKPTRIDGAILIWGAVAPSGREAAIEQVGFADVLSIEEMITDLRRWNPNQWNTYLDLRATWMNELLSSLRANCDLVATER